MNVKILRIKASGYKRLIDNFEIEFLTKARVNEKDLEDEVIELDKKLYYPSAIAITGKNSSGKTTILKLIAMCYEILNTGRIEYQETMFSKDKILLDIWFIQKSIIYHYYTEVNKPSIILFNKSSNCILKNEKLYVRNYSYKYAKKILDEEYVEMSIQSKMEDTSILYDITRDNYLFGSLFDFSKNNYLKLFIDSFDIISPNVKKYLIQLYDDSIEKIENTDQENYYIVKRINEEEKRVNFDYLLSTLSDGTIRGFILFTFSIITLKLGKVLIIDEIENSFHKNLIENLIIIFSDKRINKKHASLIFSTHYVEILDIFRRSDNVYVCDKENGFVTCKNIYEDFDNETRNLKSNLYNKNAFNTNLNYEMLMNLKRELINEVSDND